MNDLNKTNMDRGEEPKWVQVDPVKKKKIYLSNMAFIVFRMRNNDA